jgi:alkanesulfonate monooxygenase SsuD/methylene tetrahydromethanopterin reductase-like flavin-dependent oxidoreductase (luciferase family)
MHYALTLPNGGIDAKLLVEFARLAEEAGWEGVFLEDYIVWQGHMDVPTYDPWVLLGAMAMVTKRLLLGTMVTPLARRRPWKVAREAVTLDHISGGRVILGVGLGDTDWDSVTFSHFGEITDPRKRAKRLDESLDIVAGLWTGEPFSYQGEYYKIKETTLLPKPVQTPRIPIWVGGAYPFKGPMCRAARWDGACPYKFKTHYMTPEDIRTYKAFIDENRASQGPFDICHGGNPRREDWEEEKDYIRSLAEAGMTWWSEYVPPDEPDSMRASIARGPLRID